MTVALFCVNQAFQLSSTVRPTSERDHHNDGCHDPEDSDYDVDGTATISEGGKASLRDCGGTCQADDEVLGIQSPKSCTGTERLDRGVSGDSVHPFRERSFFASPRTTTETS